MTTEQQKEEFINSTHDFPRTQKGELLMAQMIKTLLPKTKKEEWERSMVEPVEA